MGSSSIINGFDKEHKFLGNDYVCNMTVWGKNYPTLDHAYQAGKTQDNAEKELIRSRPTALAAWQTGQAMRMPRHWIMTRIAFMKKLLMIKFEIPDLQARLLETGSAQLVFLHYRDSFWGKLSYHSPPLGGNRLGVLLEEVRKYYKPFKRNILV